MRQSSFLDISYFNFLAYHEFKVASPFDVEEVLSKLSNAEKASLLSGIAPTTNGLILSSKSAAVIKGPSSEIFFSPIPGCFLLRYNTKLHNGIYSATNSSIGIDFWHTYPIPEYSVPSIRLSDGPNGLGELNGSQAFSRHVSPVVPR